MIVAYDIPNVTHMTDLFINANTATGGLYGLGILLTAYVIFFMTLKRNGYPNDKSLVAASFSSLLICALLIVLTILPAQYVVIPIIGLLVGIFLVQASENE